MLLPQEIAEELSPDKFEKLCTLVEEKYHKSFGIVSVKDNIVTVELEDNTQQEVKL